MDSLMENYTLNQFVENYTLDQIDGNYTLENLMETILWKIIWKRGLCWTLHGSLWSGKDKGSIMESAESSGQP